MLLKGILLALTLAILFGPAFFMLLQITVERGWKSAIYFCIGVWTSDFIYLNLAYFGMNLAGEAMKSPSYQQNIGYIGAAILMTFGVVSIFAKEKPLFVNNEKIAKRNILVLGVKGFLINSLNPFLFIFWLGVVTSMGFDLDRKNEFWWFVLGFISVIILTDLLKVYLAKLIRGRLRPMHLVYFRKIAGGILFGFGLYLLYGTF